MAEANIEAIAREHGVSRETAEKLLDGLRRTNGKQVQFSNDELGGMGQWMPGMVMVGRMGDHALKAKVDALCRALVELIGSAPEEQKQEKGTTPTPDDLPKKTTTVSANSAGSQNGVRYAYFAATNRLEIQKEGDAEPTTYDVTGHHITGVAQGQSSGNPGTLRFTTDTGETIDLSSLKRVA